MLLALFYSYRVSPILATICRPLKLQYFSFVQLDKVHLFVYFMNIRRISFYRSTSGKCPVDEHLDSLTDEQATKIAWVLKLIRELDQIPSKYFKKLVNTNDIWEVRVDVGSNTFRLLGFFGGRELIILTNSFQKKSQKIPIKEIRLAEKRKKDFLNRKIINGWSG